MLQDTPKSAKKGKVKGELSGDIAALVKSVKMNTKNRINTLK